MELEFFQVYPVKMRHFRAGQAPYKRLVSSEKKAYPESGHSLSLGITSTKQHHDLFYRRGSQGTGGLPSSQSDLMLEQDPLLGSYPSLLPALSCPHYPFCISHSKATA